MYDSFALEVTEKQGFLEINFTLFHTSTVFTQPCTISVKYSWHAWRLFGANIG